MTNMNYCRHENTARDLEDVWDQWWDTDVDALNSYEAKGRERIARLVAEMYGELLDDGTFDDYGINVYYTEPGDDE